MKRSTSEVSAAPVVLYTHKQAGVSLALGVIGFVLTGWGFVAHPERAFHAYLAAYMFVLSCALGATAFVAIAHAANTTWPVAVHRLPEAIMPATANMYVLLTSSFTVVLALHAMRASAPRSASLWLGVSALLGCAFIAIKALEYRQHIVEGALPGPYYHFARAATLGGNRFYTLYWVTTFAHALHVLGGIAVLLWTARHALQGRYSRQDHARFENATLYWHFVDVMWIFIWPIYYLA